jgi:WD40 repeat protein
LTIEAKGSTLPSSMQVDGDGMGEAMQGKPRGLIAVDKMGGKVLFLDPESYETLAVLDDFARVPHELVVVRETATAYVPIYGDGVHGRNPHPGHLISVIDLRQRRHDGDIDLSPYAAPHSMQIGPDGLLYVTCEENGLVAVVDLGTRKIAYTIATGSTNAHRLTIAPDGRHLFTENEEDATVSVIDVLGRALLRKIATPNPLAGLAVSPDGGTVIAVDDVEPLLHLISTTSWRIERTVRLDGGASPGQVARYSPDGTMLFVTSMASGTATLLDASFGNQTVLAVGKQPMDGAYRDGTVSIACQGDGSIHVIDLATRRVTARHSAGIGCETLAFF